MLSQFAKQILDAPRGFDFVAAHFACERDRYSAENPNGYVNLGSAQNFLHSSDTSPIVSAETHQEDSRYHPFAGTDGCKVAVADYLTSLSGVGVAANQIVIGNGIISLLEALAKTIVDPAETVLVPTPVFPGLVTSLKLRLATRVEFVHTRPSAAFRLSSMLVERAIEQQRNQGHKVKALLLCSPGNPVGQVFDIDDLSAFVRIAEKYDVALIVDEVYAGSCLRGSNFQSAITARSNNVFVLGGLSKDFGLAGYATGWLHSINPDVLVAVAKQSHFFRLPASVQRQMQHVLERSRRETFLVRNRQRLSYSDQLARNAFADMDVSVAAAGAGLCHWLDLRAYLESQDAAGELGLYKKLLHEHRVHISPGSGFHCSTPGFFRICFSQQERTLREGLLRIQRGLDASKPSLFTPRAGQLGTRNSMPRSLEVA